MGRFLATSVVEEGQTGEKGQKESRPERRLSIQHEAIKPSW
jgi:hypothetical protein